MSYTYHDVNSILLRLDNFNFGCFLGEGVNFMQQLETIKKICPGDRVGGCRQNQRKLFSTDL